MFQLIQLTDDERIVVGSFTSKDDADQLAIETMRAIVDELTETGCEGFVIDEETWTIWQNGEVVYSYLVDEV